MKKISSFSGKNFRVEESYSFHKHAVLLSEKLEVDSLFPLVEEYKKSFIALGDAIDEQTAITSARHAQNADNARGAAWRGANSYFNTISKYDPDKKSKESAKSIQILFKKYGVLNSLSMHEKTGIIENLLQSIRALPSSTIKSCSGERWIALLEEKQEKYIVAAEARTQERASKVTGLVKNARTKADNDFKELSDTINAMAKIQGEGLFSEFIANVNVLIESQRKVARQRKKGAQNVEYAV